MASPAERAAKMVRENRYLSLATMDADGPWVAPINYVAGPGRHLSFYSANNARHSQAIERRSAIALSIFDSTAQSVDVDGLQVDGTCRAVYGADLDAVHEYYFRENFPDAATREWWYRPADLFSKTGIWSFYTIEFNAAYVIDYESIEQERIDRRVEVDISDLWAAADLPSLPTGAV